MNEEDKGLVPSATILRINEQARRLPPVLGEFAVQERAQLLERIAELDKDLDNARVNWGQVRLELATLKAQPSGVVLPPHVNTGAAIQGILQAIGIDGDVSYHLAGQVWNSCLDEVARLNPAPAPGFVLVPLEPTEAMRIASYVSDVPWPTRAKIYRDMVATLLEVKP